MLIAFKNENECVMCNKKTNLVNLWLWSTLCSEECEKARESELHEEVMKDLESNKNSN